MVPDPGTSPLSVLQKELCDTNGQALDGDLDGVAGGALQLLVHGFHVNEYSVRR